MPADKTTSVPPESVSFARTVRRPLPVSHAGIPGGWAKTAMVVLVGFVIALQAGSVNAEMTDSQKRMTANLKTAVDRAADLFKQEKYSDAASELKRAQKILDNLNKKPDADVLKQIDKSYRRMKKAHELLTTKGQTLEPLKELPAAPPSTKKSSKRNGDEEDGSDEEPAEEDAAEESSDEGDESEENSEEKKEEKKESTSRKSTSRAKTAKKAPKSKEEDVQEVSFTREIAPILVEHCGRCHVDGNRGEYSLASYQTMMDGTSITAKDPDASTMLQMIESGDMPPKRGGRGQPVPEEDVQKIRDWITQGARFDGPDAEANLKEL